MSYKPSNPNGQATMANSAPVVIASNQSAIPVTGTFWQTTQPVSLASVPSHPVTNAGTFPVQVSSALPTGANAIGSITNTTFAATQSGTWTVGLSAAQTLATVTNLAQLGGTAISMNTGVRDAGTQRVTIATNDSVPVTGTFWQATQPVSLASVPSHPVTNAGTFAVQATQSGTWNIGTVTAITSVNAVIPGVGATNLGKQTDSAAGATDTGVAMLGIRDDALTTLTPVDGDYTRFRFNSVGRLWTSAIIDAALPTGTNSIGNIGTITNQTQMNGQAISMGTGVRDAGTQRVTIATNDSVPVTGTFWQTTQPVSGTVTANAGTGNFTVTQATASNLNATVTGTVELGATSLAALENINVTIPGTVELGTISLTALESITVVQPTAANFLNKPYGSVTTAAPTYINSTDNALSLTTSGALRIDGSGSTQPVSGTFWQATQPVSGTVAATQSGTWNIATLTNQTQMNGQAISMGTGVRDAGTQRVTIATNDSVPVTGTFWQATQPVSLASLPTLPAGTNNIGDVDVLSIIPGTAATNLGKATNSVAGATDTGVAILGVREDVLITLPSADGDYTRLKLNSVGRVWTTAVIDTALPAGTNSIGNIATLTNQTQMNGQAISMGTGVRDAGTQRVTIATNDSVPVTGTFYLATQPVSGTVSVNALPAGTNNIGDVDVLSIIPGTAATNLGKQTDSAAGATDTGVAILGIRDDVLATLTPVDGDYTRFRVNSVGRLWTSATIDAALPAGTNAIGSITNTTFASTQSGTWTVGLSAAQTLGTVTNLSQLGGQAISMGTGVRDAGTQRVTIATNDSVPVTGAFWQATQPVSIASVPSHPVTNAGTFPVQVSSALPAGTNNIGDVDVLSIIPGTAATNLGKAVDSASGATDTGVAMLAIRDDALATVIPVDGDYSRLRLTSVGRLWTSATIDAALPTGANVIGGVTQSGTWNIATVTTLSQFAGQAINLGAGTTSTGTLRTVEASATTGTQATPSLSTTSATLLAANTNRRGASVFNNSTSIVYVRLSATASSTTTFTVKLEPNDYYEVPSNYNGAITAILNTGTTTAVQVTEIT